MAKAMGTVEIDINRCRGCNRCVVAWPTSVLALREQEVNDRGYYFAYALNPDACVGCGSYALVCPDGCIEVYRLISGN